MQNRIVVLGGSFNPPTIAHLELMRMAIRAVDARLGLFVPTNYEYVAKKMKRQKCPQDTLSDAARLEMLRSMCIGEEHMAVNALRMSHSELDYDYETLQALHKEYPEDELFFVTGSDKLFVLPRWHRVEELVNDYRILVAKRGEDDLEKIKEVRPFIAEHWDRFTVFPVPDEILQISSSAFRERVHQGDLTASELVTENVWNLLDQYGKLPWNAITDFHAEGYEFLSNFYPAFVTYQGLTFQNNEAAFQAQKTLDEREKEQFTELSPGKAKGIGRRVALRPDWEEVKTEIMYEIVLSKFTQHPELAEKLLATGDKTLVEGNNWNDTCWGVDLRTGQGENRLGKLLMLIRQKLQKEGADNTSTYPFLEYDSECE